MSIFRVMSFFLCFLLLSSNAFGQAVRPLCDQVGLYPTIILYPVYWYKDTYQTWMPQLPNRLPNSNCKQTEIKYGAYCYGKDRTMAPWNDTFTFPSGKNRNPWNIYSQELWNMEVCIDKQKAGAQFFPYNMCEWEKERQPWAEANGIDCQNLTGTWQDTAGGKYYINAPQKEKFYSGIVNTDTAYASWGRCGIWDITYGLAQVDGYGQFAVHARARTQPQSSCLASFSAYGQLAGGAITNGTFVNQYGQSGPMSWFKLSLGFEFDPVQEERNFYFPESANSSHATPWAIQP